MNAKTEDFTRAAPDLVLANVPSASLRDQMIGLLQGFEYSHDDGVRRHAYTVRSAAKTVGATRRKVQQVLLALVAERLVTYRLLSSGEHLYKLVDQHDAKWAAFSGPGARLVPAGR